jgi:hypothetical protein
MRILLSFVKFDHPRDSNHTHARPVKNRTSERICVFRSQEPHHRYPASRGIIAIPVVRRCRALFFSSRALVKGIAVWRPDGRPGDNSLDGGKSQDRVHCRAKCRSMENALEEQDLKRQRHGPPDRTQKSDPQNGRFLIVRSDRSDISQ